MIRAQKVTLTVVYDDDKESPPSQWVWTLLLDMPAHSWVRVDSAENVDVPEEVVEA